MHDPSELQENTEQKLAKAESKSKKSKSRKPAPKKKKEATQEEEEYEVEAVRDHKYRDTRRGKELQLLVKWKNYPETDNTWQEFDQFVEDAPTIFRKYFMYLDRERDKIRKENSKMFEELKAYKKQGALPLNSD